jgi:hypothetical protein
MLTHGKNITKALPIADYIRHATIPNDGTWFEDIMKKLDVSLSLG